MNVLRSWIRAFAWWILRTVKPLETEIDQAIRGAFQDCGMSEALYTPEFDLRNSGKLHEVLVHASNRLGNPLITVNQLRELLK